MFITTQSPITRRALAALLAELEACGWQLGYRYRGEQFYLKGHRQAARVQTLPSGRAVAQFGTIN